MTDGFTETSTKSWFERLKGSLKSIVLGIVLFIVAFPVLWWNEGRAVQTAKSLAEGAAAVVSIPADKVDPANENKLVHTTGMATTDETLKDSEFGISQNAIKLIRRAEMYQWQEDEHTETKRQTGGSEKTTTTYTYDTDWSESVIDSSDFKKPDGHKNPTSMPCGSTTQTAQRVTLGAFELSASQVDRLNQAEPLLMTDELLQQVPAAIRRQLQIRAGAFYRPVNVPVVNQVIPAETRAPAAMAFEATDAMGLTLPSSETTDDNDAASDTKAGDEPIPVERSEDGRLGQERHSGAEGQAGKEEAENAQPPAESDAAPQVGDVRIAFSVVKPTTVSLIAQQSGETFRPYPTKAGDALDVLDAGNLSAESMFQTAVTANNRLTWILRLIGFVLMLIGVSMVWRPLAVVADVLPLVGDLARGGIFFLALAISLPLSLMTIAIAWLAYRPILGACLIVAAVLAGMGVFVAFRKKKPAT